MVCLSIMPISDALAQCNQVPALQYQLAIDAILRVGFDSSASARSSVMEVAVQAWQTALNAESAAVSVTTYGGTTQHGGSNIVVKVGDTGDNNAVASVQHMSNGTINGGTITLNADNYANWSDTYLQFVIMHEVGHHLGFADVTCDAQEAAMAEYSNWEADATGAYSTSSLVSGGSTERSAIEDTYGTWTCDNPTECSPIILDLDGDGRIMMSAADVFFDIGGTGNPVYSGWTRAGSGDGFLFLDRNGNGRVDDGRELFGNATPLSLELDSAAAATHGFAALAMFDRREFGGNDDNHISMADSVYPQLRVWIDANRDGVSEAAEIRRLSDVGVLAISLEYRLTRRRDRFGNEFRFVGRFVKIDPDGSTRWFPAIDVFPVIK